MVTGLTDLLRRLAAAVLNRPAAEAQPFEPPPVEPLPEPADLESERVLLSDEYMASVGFGPDSAFGKRGADSSVPWDTIPVIEGEPGPKPVLPHFPQLLPNETPTGSWMGWLSTSAPSDPGWLLCNGATISRTTYAALFAVIGTAYGAGDGSTTFLLPDWAGLHPMGYKAADADYNAIGVAKNGGFKTHGGDENDHADHTVPAHSHTGPAHTHTGPEHNHTTESHVHGVDDHTHVFTGDAIDLAAHTHITTAGDYQTIDEFTDLQVGAIRESPTPTMTATGTNAANGPGSTSYGGGEVTGVGGTGSTGSGGTGATSEESLKTLTHSSTDNRSPFFVTNYIIKV